MAKDPLEPSGKKTLSKLKTGAFSRGFALAKLSAQAGAKAASSAVGGIFADSATKEGRAMALLKSQLELVAQQLGELKGSLMKAGQMLSVYGENFFPPEVNQVLKSLQSDSPPLAWNRVREVLASELGEARLSLLEIETESYASASLGQVHRARILATGEEIVLKIQYPGVDRAIDSDILTLKRVLSFTKLLTDGFRLDQLFEEVREMLKQEVDYGIELKWTEAYRNHIAGDSRFLVPKTYPEFSSKKVLATAFEPGSKIDSEEVKALSQERRNALGLAGLELYLREVFEFRLVQTDPHFGNYRVRLATREGEADRLILFDFGACREFSPAFVKSYQRMVRGGFEQKRGEVIAGAIEVGFLMPSDTEVMKDAFYEFCLLVTEPWMNEDELYDFGSTDLPRRVMQSGKDLVRVMGIRPPPREIVFLDRKIGGVFIFLSALRVKTRGREILSKYLESLT